MKRHAAIIISAMGAATLLTSVCHADVCGSGFPLPARTWTMFSAPCIPPVDSESINTQFNGDLGVDAEYGNTWLMYTYDPTGIGKYVYPAVDDSIEQGVGYWIYSSEAGTLKIDGGTHTNTNVTPDYLADCAEYGWSGQPCYKIDLAVPPTTAVTDPVSPVEYKWNLVGYPFPRGTDWADVRIAHSDNGGTVDVDGNAIATTWTAEISPSAADAAGYISKNVYVFNDTGNAYDTFDDVTSDLADRQLNPNKAYWIQSKDVTDTTNIALLIPAPTYTVFVTSESYTGDLGGLAGADSKCMEAASSGSVPTGTYKAWLSTAAPNTASDRLDHAGPYTGSSGLLVAKSWTDFASASHLSKIDLDENAAITSTVNVWTGTSENGSTNSFLKQCVDWSSLSASESGSFGDSSLSTSGWSATSNRSCDQLSPLYCISQD